MGNIESVEKVYRSVKEYIVYDAFTTILIGIVLFIVFHKLWDEYSKNIAGGKRFDMGAYWGQVKIYIIVCFIASASGMIFNVTESLCTEMQEKLITGFGGDSASKSIDTMIDLVKEQNNRITSQEVAGFSFNNANPFYVAICNVLSGVAMAVGVFIFKYTYTFFILGRYMWLLLLDLAAPIAIVLIIHEGTRSYFYSWLRNMILCYLLIPMFLLADKFGNEMALSILSGMENAGSITTLLVVFTAVWVKIKMFSVVRSRSNQLF